MHSQSTFAEVAVGNRRYRWFLRPLDEQTSRAIGSELDDSDSLTEIEVRVRGDVAKLKVWEAPRPTVNFFNNSRQSGGDLSFEIYNQAHGDRYARKWTFESRNKTPLRRRRATKQAMRATRRR